MKSARFSTDCTRCPRLAAFLQVVRTEHPDYYALPVAPFGDERPKLLIVGLAPGMHGANRTGRPFTGDHAGILLYHTLHRFGWANQSESIRLGDGLRLTGCRITNAVKCLPPQNKPERVEVRTCNPYLAQEIASLPASAGILALGAVAHEAVLMALDLPIKSRKFTHGAVHELTAFLPVPNKGAGAGRASTHLGETLTFPHGLRLYDSYHCSRYNTQTKRLTAAMFEAVFTRIKADQEGEAIG
ncbi:MAG: uracil-DNA glycosylase [Betaproteobacteria bacterium]|nr:uracil-DNA glycosylase [Betaproteobacteria bacterium]